MLLIKLILFIMSWKNQLSSIKSEEAEAEVETEAQAEVEIVVEKG